MYLPFHSIEILLETFFPAATCSEGRCPCSLCDSMCSRGSIPWYCVEVIGQLHAPAALPWRKSLQCRLNRRLGDFQSWRGRHCIYYYYYYYYYGDKIFTILKVPRRCPLVLLARVGRKHGEAWGSEEGSMLGSGLLEVWSRGMTVDVWTKF